MDKSQRSDIERRDCCSRVHEELAGMVRKAVPMGLSNKVSTGTHTLLQMLRTVLGT